MSDVGGPDRASELARGLSRSVTLALDDTLPSRSVDSARQAAQLFSLHGLDRLLSAVAPYAAGVWPAPLKPVIERLQRAATECERAGQIDVFRRMDDELGLMARAIERVPLARLSTPATTRSEAPAVESPIVPLAEALEGVPGDRHETELIRRVRLRTPVAGALRAALDWLVGGNPARMRMWLTTDGSALDVVCEGIAYTGIQPASEVLASVGAHLGPTGERPGAWTVRVPIRAERETYLMLEQGDLQIAVPWHAVVRVRLIPSDTIDIMLRRQALPVLPPIKVSARRMSEQPVAVVALGLKRACLVADRLVWRMSAEPTPPPGPSPAEGIHRAVESDNGEIHWVFEPEWLLRGVAAPTMGQPTARLTAPSVTRTPAPASTVQREPIPFPSPAELSPQVRADAPLATLGSEFVEPIEAPDPAPDPAAPATIGAMADTSTRVETQVHREPQVPSEPSLRDTSSPRRALVAENSIAARIYLVRLLERHGFDVHAAATATELRAMLTRGPWALVCVDSALTEVAGGALHDLADAATAAGATIVALVRDAEDDAAARAAGMTATLRKPIDPAALELLLERAAHDAPAAPGPGTLGNEPDPREWGAR